ncbi:response regulator [Paracoccus sp. (in: a-proteobacteria)]|uniref:response regulator n=1 Tax=Paracoccus sp. TaxID=267 RepID=UPI00396C68E0
MTQESPPCPAILVVEDEVLIRMEAVDMLEDAGFRTYEAKSADAAMVILQTRPDIGLLFTDVDMPGSMNGLSLAAHVREQWPSIKIVIASGVIDLSQEDLPKGACFFPKPYPSSDIVERLKAMCR